MVRVCTKNGLWRLVLLLRPCLPTGLLENLGQWLRRGIPDPDFGIFAELAEVEGLCLDVGANRGHLAIAVLRQTRLMRVLSVEPNWTYRWSLLLISLLHPWRFRFRLLAAGSEVTKKVLHVPGRRNSGLGTQASLDHSEFERDYIRERLADVGFDVDDKSGFRTMEVSVTPLDTLGLAPVVIKIDVEGFEHQALMGLAQTLRKHRPVLLVELNHPDRWVPMLAELGYSFYAYNAHTRCLVPYKQTPGVCNLVCLNENSRSKATRSLFSRVVK